MINLKRLATAAGITALLATGASARELQLGSVAPADSPWGNALTGFAALVGQMSGGELTVTHFPAGQLGQEQEMARQLARGRLDMASLSNTAMSLLVPEVGLLSAPYLFDSHAHSDCTYGLLEDTFQGMLADAGAVRLGPIEVGYQVILTMDEVAEVPADLAGQKIRSAPTSADTIYLSETGASPVPLNIPETMQGLQTGALSGATWPTIFAVAAGFTQVAPNVTVTNHVHQVGGVLISHEVWMTLTEEEQAWLTAAADEGFPGLTAGIRKAEVDLLAAAEAGGATVYTPTEEEMAQWRAVAETANAKIVADYGGDAEAIWATIQEAAGSCAQ